MPYSKEQLREAAVGTIEELTGDVGVACCDRTNEYYDAARYWGGG